MKDFLQVTGVFSSSLTFEYHIINVHFNDVANQWLKIFGHQPLIRGPSVLESKWHDFVTVKSMRGYEGSFSSSSGAIGIW